MFIKLIDKIFYSKNHFRIIATKTPGHKEKIISEDDFGALINLRI